MRPVSVAGQIRTTGERSRGKEDLELTEFHRYLTGIRNRTSVFRRGAFKPLLAENGVIAYGRF